MYGPVLIGLALVTTLLCAGLCASAGSFDPGKAAFRVRFKDEVTPYRVTGVFVLPGEKLEIEVPAGETASACSLDVSVGQAAGEGLNRWTWEAPHETGDASIVIRNADLRDSVTLNAFVMIPFKNLTGEYLNGYRVGKYPGVSIGKVSIYGSPAGFIEVTERNFNTLVSPHFQLGQFICKQDGGYPKYIVLRERLVLKLELILEHLNMAGHGCNTLEVMSGYRTPYYNKAIGNVEYSRHLWGGAADIFVDSDPADGMMDDLNGDGVIDLLDARVISDLIDRMYGRPWYERFIGGLAKYRSNSRHGPFVHVDVRGKRARWGT